MEFLRFRMAHRGGVAADGRDITFHRDTESFEIGTADSTDGYTRGGFTSRGAFQCRPDVVVTIFDGGGEVGMAGARPSERPIASDLLLGVDIVSGGIRGGVDRVWTHHGLPLGPLRVADPDRNRRSEAAPMPHPAEELDLVALGDAIAVALLEARGETEKLARVRAATNLADVHYLRQGDPLGLGHAVLRAKQHVGDEAFAVLLGDDIMTHRPPLISEMMDLHGRTGGSVIALKEVPHEEISLYGCAEPGDRDGDVVEFRGVVEKPAPEDAPSNLAVVGRYLFTPRIFEFLEDAQPGVGGEIQLTDAMDKLLAVEPMHGLIFESGRYDIGQKIDFLRATVEMTLERDDLGPEFASFLARLVAERGLT